MDALEKVVDQSQAQRQAAAGGANVSNVDRPPVA